MVGKYFSKNMAEVRSKRVEKGSKFTEVGYRYTEMD
jgi:hypothetical protein